MALLSSQIFPPGSSRSFIDALVRQQQTVTDTGKKTDDNTTNLDALTKAVNALSGTVEGQSNSITQAQNTANEARDTANTALTRANNAGNGVGDINMNAVFKNTNATQTVGGPFGASQFNVSGNKVVGARQGGWTASRGTAQPGNVDCDVGYNASGNYNQGDIQALANGLNEVRKLAVALQFALTNHGLIG